MDTSSMRDGSPRSWNETGVSEPIEIDRPEPSATDLQDRLPVAAGAAPEEPPGRSGSPDRDEPQVRSLTHNRLYGAAEAADHAWSPASWRAAQVRPHPPR